MKKNLWGYNVQEVDENIEYLESVNARLEKQIKQLTVELEAEKNRDPSCASADHAELAQAKGQLSALTSEVERLKNENKRLSEQLNSAPSTDEFSHVGNICRSAYEDMAAAKENTRESLKTAIDTFGDNWALYQKRLSEISAQISNAQEASREAFLSAADEILGCYASFEQEHKNMTRQMQEIEHIKDELHKKLDVLLADADAGAEENTVEAEPETVQDKHEAQLHAVLRVLEQRKQPLPSSAPQKDHPFGIGVSFGVNTKNIINE